MSAERPTDGPDVHPAGCKCPPCYYSDDEPFTGALAKAMPRPTVQLTGPLDGHDHEHPDRCPCGPVQLDGLDQPVHRDERIPGGHAYIYTEEPR